MSQRAAEMMKDDLEPRGRETPGSNPRRRKSSSPPQAGRCGHHCAGRSRRRAVCHNKASMRDQSAGICPPSGRPAGAAPRRGHQCHAPRGGRTRCLGAGPRRRRSRSIKRGETAFAAPQRTRYKYAALKPFSHAGQTSRSAGCGRGAGLTKLALLIAAWCGASCASTHAGDRSFTAIGLPLAARDVKDSPASDDAAIVREKLAQPPASRNGFSRKTRCSRAAAG